MQPDGESGIKEETASDEFSGSILPETELLDGEPVEEPGTATATFCIACGENIPENALFCPYCGERQATVDEKEEGEITTVSLGSESDIDSSRFLCFPFSRRIRAPWSFSLEITTTRLSLRWMGN